MLDLKILTLSDNDEVGASDKVLKLEGELTFGFFVAKIK